MLDISRFEPWPKNYPEHHNGGQLCDMKVGPCSCGAWHRPGEFWLVGRTLFRYNTSVATGDTRLKPNWTVEEIKRREFAFKQGENMKNVTVLKRRWESDGAKYVYVPILKGQSFDDLKALEKCIMDESFINCTNNHEALLTNKRGDVFLIITPDGCKILRLVPTEFKPQWNDWG